RTKAMEGRRHLSFGADVMESGDKAAEGSTTRGKEGRACGSTRRTWLWMCKNNQYDPSQRLYSSDRRSRSPPPLCEFIEYVDTEQTPEDIAHVYRVAQRARRYWFDMEAEETREEERRKMRQEDEERRRKYEAERKQREEAERRRKQEEDRLAYEAREAERERMHERARRARAAGPDAFRKGKYPRCTQ
ncbi:hypothetical protein EJB05_04451, partial [Eragrostis curvula]